MTRLKLWRLQERLTQAQAARYLGIGESTLAILESGRLRPTGRQIDVLQRTFGNRTAALFEPVPDDLKVAAP